MRRRIFVLLMLVLCATGAFGEVLLSIVKTPFERFACSADFASEVASGVISLTSVTAKNSATGADATARVIAASPAPAIVPGTSRVSFAIQGGNDTESYYVSVKVTSTATGENFEGVFIVNVRAR